MNKSTILRLLLRVDAGSNLALAFVLGAFAATVADGLGLSSRGAVWGLAVGLGVNGIWLLRMSRAPRAAVVRMSGILDLVFVGLMIVLVASEAAEPWARTACGVLGAAVALVGLAKLYLAAHSEGAHGERVSANSAIR